MEVIGQGSTNTKGTYQKPWIINNRLNNNAYIWNPVHRIGPLALGPWQWLERLNKWWSSADGQCPVGHRPPRPVEQMQMDLQNPVEDLAKAQPALDWPWSPVGAISNVAESLRLINSLGRKPWTRRYRLEQVVTNFDRNFATVLRPERWRVRNLVMLLPIALSLRIMNHGIRTKVLRTAMNHSLANIRSETRLYVRHGNSLRNRPDRC